MLIRYAGVMLMLYEDEILQQKIDHEIKMRDGTAKLLAASKRPNQLLEAAKNLLTSNTRMIGFMSELQKRKTNQVLKRRGSEDENQTPCSAQVCISDLRIPLMWKDTDHFKNKGDHRRYAVFCLWRVGTEIYDTSLVRDVDRSCTDVCFDDVIVFNDVKPTFECKLEVYCHKQLDDFTIASTPKKIKKKMNELSSSIGRSVGRRLSGMKDDSEFMSNMLVGPKYEQIGCATLRLKDVCSDVGTFDLSTLDTSSHNEGASELPLWGNYCVRLAAQPACLVKDAVKGELYIQRSLYQNWQKMFCSVKNLQLRCWNSEENLSKEPNFTIPITKESQVSNTDPTTCERQHTFLIDAVKGRRKQQYVLAAESEEGLRKWWHGLQQHMLDQVMWQHACEEVMDIKTPTPRQTTTVPFSSRRSKCVSLYEETPWKETADFGKSSDDSSPMARVLARLNVTDVPADTLAALASSTAYSADDSHVNSSGYNTIDSMTTISSCSSDEVDSTSAVTGIPHLTHATSTCSHMQTDI